MGKELVGSVDVYAATRHSDVDIELVFGRDEQNWKKALELVPELNALLYEVIKDRGFYFDLWPSMYEGDSLENFHF